jgi:thioredoxin-related protein
MKPSFPNCLALTFVAAALAACSKPAETPLPATPSKTEAILAVPASEPGIAWKQVASDADVDAAFAQAKAEGKPVFVYWGAKWCPPCNQVKATLFNRHDFIERSRGFVPVYVDGDGPGAQKLGTRFKVRGYPTMVLFNPQGAELTRLPGEVDAAQYTQVLTLGMNAQRPVKAVLADARAGGQGLSPGDWRLMAFYSWDTDEQQLVAKPDLGALLKQLADACPTDQKETAARLLLKALAAVETKSKARPDARARARVLELLADAGQARVQMDVLTNNAADITRALSATGTPERVQVVQALDQALQRLAADATLSRADRMGAVIARVDLVRIDLAKAEESRVKVALPEALLAQVREHSARADREITDGYERQAVITTAAYMLEHAGLLDESDALLKANLAKSHSPYYLMSELASNAKKRGDNAAALRWYEQAFDKSEGPATRLQWGASYVSALVDLTPHDSDRIERAVQQLFDEAAAQPDAFYKRSGRSLQRIGAKLLAWNKGQAHSPALRRLQAKLGAVCARLDAADPQRASCAALLKVGKPKPAGAPA